MDCSSSPSPGTICSDGTIYAGDSPDGNEAMYVTRCDAGQTWDGSECTGSRYTLPWNAGNTTGYVETGYTSSVDGDGNSAGIAALDADSETSGDQDHYAAAYCEDLVEDGYSDWYLPAWQELTVIYNNSDVIDNLDTSGTYYYWSSSELNSSRAYRERISDGLMISNDKYGYNAVRCTRR